MSYDITTHLYLYTIRDNDASERLFPIELYELLNSPFREQHFISMFAYFIECHVVFRSNNRLTSKMCTLNDVAKVAPFSCLFETQQ